jgi:hypothetical protein
MKSLLAALPYCLATYLMIIGPVCYGEIADEYDSDESGSAVYDAADYKDAFVAPRIFPPTEVESVEKISVARQQIRDQLVRFDERRQESTAVENREVTRALLKSDYDAVVVHFEGDADAAVALLSRVFEDRNALRVAYGLEKSNEGAQEVVLLPGAARYATDSAFGATPESAHGNSVYRFMLMSDGSIERVAYSPDEAEASPD